MRSGSSRWRPTSSRVPAKMRTMFFMKAVPSTSIASMSARPAQRGTIAIRRIVRWVFSRSSVEARKARKSWVPTSRWPASLIACRSR